MDLLIQIVVCAFVPFMATVTFIPLVRRLAISRGFVDTPGGRKKHVSAVPPIGGLVVFPVFIVLSLLFGLDVKEYGAFLVALTLLLAVGAWDDRFGVQPWIKFAVQMIAAYMIVVQGQAQIYNLGDILGFGTMWLGPVLIPFCFLAVMLLINGLNLLDGLDGLAGGIGVCALSWLAFCAAVAGDGYALTPLLVLAGSLCGFLVYNMRSPLRRKASVFMGDAGSLALGLSLAWFTIRLSRPDVSVSGEPIIQPITVAWLLALPIIDTCAQFTRRLLQKKHPFAPDHNHFHHHFVDAGLPDGRAVAMILMLVFIGGGIGVVGVLYGVPEYVLAYIWIAVLFIHIFMSLRPHRYRKLIGRLFTTV